ncbi:MAG: NUDIX domain-containing protein [Alicyclobacillus herbarius]|uniref:NUDIX domain-containing protein n=1 Tax=Alicyclobacillus herbarius TaxID=122960 RepID=UPI0023570155|nr:NUDIX domain-containing protein [Alicyclobacillus herbarius]MCL6631579.1 NUDIX domain-containing protein [Alicyclobacillus herbarius]
MQYEYETWQPAVAIRLHRPSVERPHSVLVFPIYRGSIVWVKHPVRGWEVPGGKCEPAESPEMAAVREVWEESGALMKKLTWLAEYQIPQIDDSFLFKWVYWGFVEKWVDRPSDSETIGVQLGALPNPSQLQERVDISPILKDDVYLSLYSILRKHVAASLQ